MRKLFLALMLSSALGALAIGGALAWTGSSASNGSATGGQIAFSVYALTGTGSPVLDNGSWINVANGGIANTGNVTVHVTGGTTLPTGITAGCGASGGLNVTNGGDVAPGQQFGNLYAVFLNMPAQGGDNTCQGATLPYTITVNVAS